MLWAYCAPAMALAVLALLSSPDAPDVTAAVFLPASLTFLAASLTFLAVSRSIHLFSSVGRSSNLPSISAIRRKSLNIARTPAIISSVANSPNTFLTSARGLTRKRILCDPPRLAQPLCASLTVLSGSFDLSFRVLLLNFWLVPVNCLLRPGACAVRYGTFGSLSAELNMPTNNSFVKKCNTRLKYELTPQTLTAEHSRCVL